MFEIGEEFEKGRLPYIVGCKPGGTQCGILVNYTEGFTILRLSSKKEVYSNIWSKSVPGLLLYCGTNKGKSKKYNKQNLNAKLNKHLNEEIFPIYVFYETDDKLISFGRFSRIEKYDEWLNIDNKEVYRFGLISRNIDKLLPLIKQYFD